MILATASIALLTWLPPQDAQHLDLTLWENRDTVAVQGHGYSGMGNNSIDWSGLLIAHFPESQIPTALRIIACESGGNPLAKNKSSGASGLFQIMPFWADHLGIPRDALFDPSVNTEVALYVWEVQGWNAWSCY